MKKRKVPTSLQPKVETNDNEGWQQLKIEDAIRQVNAASKLENAVSFQEVLDEGYDIPTKSLLLYTNTQSFSVIGFPSIIISLIK